MDLDALAHIISGNQDSLKGVADSDVPVLRPSF